MPTATASPQALPAPTGVLLPRVEQLLTRIFDEAERGQFERFFGAAAIALEQLGAVNVSASDAPSSDEKRDLWDILPQSVHEALAQVLIFINVVQEEFPIHESVSTDDVDFNFDMQLGDEEATEQSAEDMANIFSSISMNLRHELHTIEQQLRQQTPGDKRWEVLEQLGEFRSRALSGIGEMVFLSARKHAVVRKADVVPFYQEGVESSLSLRRGITVLRARLAVHHARFERLKHDASSDAVRGRVAGFYGELEGFMASREFSNLRVVDRRSFIDVREQLHELLSDTDLSVSRVGKSIEGLVRFLDSLSLMNQRDQLAMHDKQAVSDTIAHVNAVKESVIAHDVQGARTSLSRVTRTAEPLFGRDPVFDGLLKLLANVNLEETDLDDALAIAELIRTHLSNT